MQNLIDQSQRLLALDPQQSFIVQAPAGSGKTELLVQRYLSLLATVNQPEEILAITFTRKAAAEMRARILLALQFAQSTNEKNPQQLQTQQLAFAALQRAKQLNWNLLENPNRLRIYTIDAFCRYLTQQMPVLSRFAAQLDSVDDAQGLYQQAAETLLTSLESDETWTTALEKLLLHLDNDFNKAKQLFIEMLKQRDQWLPKILKTQSLDGLRTILEQALINITQDAIKQCQLSFPPQLRSTALSLLNYAHNNLAKPVINGLETFEQWLIMGHFLMTERDQQFFWRKRITKTEGFPVTTHHETEMKQRMIMLLEELQQHEDLRKNFENLMYCPTPGYSQSQWELLQALLELLPILSAKLLLVFANSGKIDFIQIAAAANQALQENESPTDLALRLDYQIQHILVDEFQDTSQTQFRLLTALTAEWQPNDKKTLFLVGDPMQSIYLFRQAEVGLFLYARQRGINHIALTPLQLQVNFRSEAGIVNWLNTVFPTIFPQQEDIATGAIKYSPSIAKSSIENNNAVHFYPSIAMSRLSQAQQLIKVIKNIQQNNPNDSIAILVRNRSHLEEIIQQLKDNQLSFQGVEIDKLSEHYIVQDLFALTRALLHLNDRIAWLAILRAPWCGLSLADLHAVAANQQNLPLLENLLNFNDNSKLSNDGKLRLQRIVPVLQQSLLKRGRASLRTWLENTWYHLGGPAAVLNVDDLRYAKTYFELLETLEQNEIEDEISWLKNKIDSLYAPPSQSAQANIQIMTIHKAKGLEFDHIILPALDRVARSNEKQLLMWMERASESHYDDLILAPISALADQEDAIYNFLRRQQKIKFDNEIKRLLYVAVTRARKSLHLFANLPVDAEPRQNSLLELLWPFYRDKFLEISANNETLITEPQDFAIPLVRLKSNWQFPTEI